MLGLDLLVLGGGLGGAEAARVLGAEEEVFSERGGTADSESASGAATPKKLATASQELLSRDRSCLGFSSVSGAFVTDVVGSTVSAGAGP